MPQRSGMCKAEHCLLEHLYSQMEEALRKMSVSRLSCVRWSGEVAASVSDHARGPSLEPSFAAPCRISNSSVRLCKELLAAPTYTIILNAYMQEGPTRVMMLSAEQC